MKDTIIVGVRRNESDGAPPPQLYDRRPGRRRGIPFVAGQRNPRAGRATRAAIARPRTRSMHFCLAED